MGVEMMTIDFLDIGDVIKRYPEITTKARSLVFSKEMKKRLVKEVTTPIKNDVLDQYGVELEIGLKKCHENDKIKVTKKGKIKTTKIGYFFDCKKIV